MSNTKSNTKQNQQNRQQKLPITRKKGKQTQKQETNNKYQSNKTTKHIKHDESQ